MIDVSLVVPVYNERESLTALHAEIAAVAAKAGLAVEVLFIDDGSSDGSWEVIRELAAADLRVRGVRFRKNFGKAAALQAGFRDARGQRIVTLDADLQDDPAEVPNFLAALAADRDLVVGWKKVRRDPWHKVFPSHVFNGMVSALTGVKLHDHNCGMKAFRAEVVRDLHLYGEMHRFIPVLTAAKGYRVGELVIHHRPRQFGRSKYGVRRFLRGFLDLLTVTFLTTYGRRPMHLFGGCVLLLILMAIVGLFWWPSVSPLTYFAIILAAVLFVQGLLAEMAAAARTDDEFSIAERTTTV